MINKIGKILRLNWQALLHLYGAKVTTISSGLSIVTWPATVWKLSSLLRIQSGKVFAIASLLFLLHSWLLIVENAAQPKNGTDYTHISRSPATFCWHCCSRSWSLPPPSLPPFSHAQTTDLETMPVQRRAERKGLLNICSYFLLWMRLDLADCHVISPG